jgi:ABC-2 type transport system permease protein
MLSLLDAERIKLFTTRSPWWCLVAAVVTQLAVAALVNSQIGTDGHTSVTQVESGYGLALLIVLIMAGLAVSTEYRFGTIRATFQAVPRRSSLRRPRRCQQYQKQNAR